MLLRHFLHKEDPSLKMSFPQEETLYGVRIRKLPVGKYLQAMNAIEGLPAALMKALFPNGQSLEQMLAVFSQLNTEGAAAILSRLLGTLPEEFCLLFPRYSGKPRAGPGRHRRPEPGRTHRDFGGFLANE